ncbi:MAG: HesA/MoeB/ThiF family protein, partial [Syntrophomonas sp.]|nr:HesA/MoeB/ThiF family protein [Syntrophomonas sp.]
LHRQYPEVNIVKHNTNFNEDNAFEIMTGYDVIIVGVDNFPTRYLLNDACYLMKKPMIEAGVAGFDGMGTTIIPDEGMCYRCLYPTIPAPGSVPSCSETGILGPVAGVMGFMEACEAAKLLTAKGTILKNSLLAFDGLDLKFEVFMAEKNPTCPLCGTNPSIRELKGYKLMCKTQNDMELG